MNVFNLGFDASHRPPFGRGLRCHQQLANDRSNWIPATAAGVAQGVMTKQDGLDLLARLDTLLLDCDGVLYRGNTLLPHTAEVSCVGVCMFVCVRQCVGVRQAPSACAHGWARAPRRASANQTTRPAAPPPTTPAPRTPRLPPTPEKQTRQALQAFRDRGKRLLFVTNNASKSRAQYVEKFTSLGLQVSAEEIVSSAYAAGAYLAEVPGLLAQGGVDAGDGASSSNGDGGNAQGKVLVVGTGGFVEELQHAGDEQTLWGRAVCACLG